MQRIPTLFVAPSSVHGRGVFTYAAIEEGTLLEVCPVLIIPKEQVKIIRETVLHDYYFTWGEAQTEAAVVLGFGSIFNHAEQHNARFLMDYEQQTMDFFAMRDIAAGEEITINYNGEEEQRELWFEVK
ncbi:MAG: SET domain-containing protein [Bacteroidota bacterium]